MRKRHNMKLNNKGFTLMEIMLAVSLMAIAVLAIGAIIIGTRNNTNQLLTDTQLQKQSNNIKEMISNEIVTTNAGIKYWVKQDDSAFSDYILTKTDSGYEYEKVLAFYQMDVRNLKLIKTYYLYNSDEKVLKKSTMTVDIPNNNTNAINVDDNIESIIDGISNWEIVTNNLTSFSMDLSNVEESALITFAIAVEQGISTYPAEVIVNVRGDLVVNGPLPIDRLISWNGGLVTPPRAIETLTYNGEYQTLIKAGNAEHGTMYYKVGEDGTWGVDLPSEKELGTYKVYYYVYGDDYYTEDNVCSYVTVTIMPQDKSAYQFGDIVEIGDYAYVYWNYFGYEDFVLGYIKIVAYESDRTILQTKDDVLEFVAQKASGITWAELQAQGVTENQIWEAMVPREEFDERSSNVPPANGWNIMAIDKNKTSYGEISSEVDDIPVVTMFETFKNCINMQVAPTIPDSITSIGQSAFEGCSSLTGGLVIPGSVISIGDSALDGCSNLTGITFDGTMAQWNAIVKATYWKSGVIVSYAQCSDGRVSLVE